MSPDHFGLGMARLRQVAHFGGHTLVGDMGIGIFNFDMEWQAAIASLDTPDTPFRVHYTPIFWRCRRPAILRKRANLSKPCRN